MQGITLISIHASIQSFMEDIESLDVIRRTFCMQGEQKSSCHILAIEL